MKLDLKAKASYGLAAVGKDMVYALSSGYVLYYYNVVMGLSATFVGIILMVARVFDAVNDPVMGIIVAKTNSRFGRFRPWLFTGTILNAFVLFALFAVPDGLEGKQLMVYFAAIYILWGTTYTIMDIPYWSMIPAVADTHAERENLSVIARSCAGVGFAVITVATMISVAKFGGGSSAADYRIGFRWFTLIISCFFILVSVIACINIKENSSVNMKTASVGQMFKSLFKNDQAMIIVIAIICVNTALYITSNLIIYFFQFDIGGAGWEGSYALFNTFGGGLQIIAMMIIYPLIRKKLSATTVFRLCLFMEIFGYLVLLIMAFTGATAVFLIFIPAFFIFSGNGMLTVLTTIFLADSVDYGEFKTGHREESVIFSMQTFVVKLASGLAALAASIGLDLINLDTDAAVQSSKTIFGLRTVMSVVPMIGLFVALFIFKKYKLDEKELAKIASKLEREDASAAGI